MNILFLISGIGFTIAGILTLFNRRNNPEKYDRMTLVTVFYLLAGFLGLLAFIFSFY